MKLLVRALPVVASAAVVLAACSRSAGEQGGRIAGGEVPQPRTLSPADRSFAKRCSQPGVVKCVGFDSGADFNTGQGGTAGAYGRNAGIYPPGGTTDYTRAVMDATIKASGAGALKFTIPSNSGADSSGLWFTNFSPDLSVQFGENDEFYVQWRQRFSAEFLSTVYLGGNGWKQVIVGSGDQPERLYQSCSDLEIVVQNSHHLGFPQMYNSCSGSSSHPAYDAFVERVGNDFRLQNARLWPNCLQSQRSTSFFPPVGNCFGYVADEWMTFQLRVKVGPRVKDEFIDSHVTLWGAREGQPSELIMFWGPYNLSAGDPAGRQRFGKIFLLPYNTKKSPGQVHATAYTWYDELIISRNMIADP